MLFKWIISCSLQGFGACWQDFSGQAVTSGYRAQQGDPISCEGAPFGCLAPNHLVGYLSAGILANQPDEASTACHSPQCNSVLCHGSQNKLPSLSRSAWHCCTRGHASLMILTNRRSILALTAWLMFEFSSCRVPASCWPTCTACLAWRGPQSTTIRGNS